MKKYESQFKEANYEMAKKDVINRINDCSKWAKKIKIEDDKMLVDVQKAYTLIDDAVRILRNLS